MRRIQHTTHLNIEHQVICDWMERHGDDVLARATETAGSTAERLILNAKGRLAFFSVDEEVSVAASPLWRATPDRAVMTLDWQADPRRRLLPNVEARLFIDAVIPRGPQAVTVLSVVGSFNPPAGLIHRIEDHAFTRRILDTVIATFLDSITRVLMEDLATEVPLPRAS